MRQETPRAEPVSSEARLRERAIALGFHRVGIAGAEALVEDHARYLDFISDGRHGSMGYLADNVEARRRVDGPEILPGARAVIVCALAYHRAEDEGPGGPDGARIARYARGRDYHNFFRRRLRKLAAWVRDALGAEARPLVDTAPVLERAWARRAGVGFVGKNGCVIVPGLGSYVLLGEVVTTAALAPDDPMPERCGACTLCLERCPTDAFIGPYALDARRCVSYLTIEQPGPIPEDLREGVGPWLFGCDACQEVCPFNHGHLPPAASTADFAPDGRWRERPLDALVALSDDEYAALAAGTPLARPGRDGLARNAAVVLGNVGARRHLPVLRAAAARDPSAVVRDAAAWAVAKIEARE